jgi:poly-beta-hydroxyalkanoate depolymerase
MIYQSFQAYSDMSGPVRAIADLAAAALAQRLPGVPRNVSQRAAAALCEIVARADQSYRLWMIPGRWCTQSPASTSVSMPS